MNTNIINNIMDRGGHEGWAVAENLDDMTKDFHFDSFEQASEFCQRVAHFCNNTDHHPEWSMLNNGCTVHVRLTSHFAGNKVTRLDFELAERMNKVFKSNAKSFKMNPMFTARQSATYQYAFGILLFGSLFVKFVSNNAYQAEQHAAIHTP